MHDTDEIKLPCADKLAFDTKQAAEATATTGEWRYGGKLKTYKCQYCHLWHLASDDS
jgi:hypothetical protein